MINVFKTRNEKEFNLVMDCLNNHANTIYESELERVMSLLENDLQKVIYLDWWYGGKLWKWSEELRNHERAERYKHVNKYDWEMANNLISETVSNGMG
jgi:hypothetical protein